MPPRGLDDALLQRRHLLRRQLDAEIAARDHHAVAQLDDLLEPLDRRRLLDLGEQRRLAADQPARLGHDPRAAGRTTARSSRRPARPRRRGRCGPSRSAPPSAAPRRGRSGPCCSTACRRPRPWSSIRSASCSITRSTSLPSSSSRRAPGFDRRENLAVRQLDAGRVARRRVAVEHEGAAGLRARPCRRRTCRRAASGPADRRGSSSAGRAPSRARGSPAITGDLRLLVAVAHVDAERVGARLEQRGDHLGRVARGAERREDADLARAGRDRPWSSGRLPRLVRGCRL